MDSGFRSDNAYFLVTTSEIFSIDSVDLQPSSIGIFVYIDGSNAAPSESILLNIENDKSQKWSVKAIATNTGDFSLLWISPEDAKFGSYTIKAVDANAKLSTYTFKILDSSNP